MGEAFITRRGGSQIIQGLIDEYLIAAGENITAGDFVSFINGKSKYIADFQPIAASNYSGSVLGCAKFNENKLAIFYRITGSTDLFVILVDVYGSVIRYVKTFTFSNVPSSGTFNVINLSNNIILISYYPQTGLSIVARKVYLDENDNVTMQPPSNVATLANNNGGSIVLVKKISENKVLVIHNRDINALKAYVVDVSVFPYVTSSALTLATTASYFDICVLSQTRAVAANLEGTAGKLYLLDVSGSSISSINTLTAGSQPNYIRLCTLDTNKCAYVFKDTLNNKEALRIITVSSDVLSSGTELNFSSDTINNSYEREVIKATNDSFIIIYKHTSFFNRIRKFNVSGTNITLDAQRVIPFSSSLNYEIFDDKLFVMVAEGNYPKGAFINYTNLDYFKGNTFVTKSKNLSSLSFTSENTITTNLAFKACVLTDKTIFVLYRDSSNNNYLTSAILQISNNTIFVSAVVLVGGGYDYVYFDLDKIDENTVLIVHANANSYGYARVARINNGSISIQNAVTFITTFKADNLKICNLSQTRAIIAYCTNDFFHLRLTLLGVSGDTVSVLNNLDTNKEVAAGNAYDLKSLKNNKAILCFSERSTGNILSCFISLSSDVLSLSSFTTILTNEITPNSLELITLSQSRAFVSIQFTASNKNRYFYLLDDISNVVVITDMLSFPGAVSIFESTAANNFRNQNMVKIDENTVICVYSKFTNTANERGFLFTLFRVYNNKLKLQDYSTITMDSLTYPSTDIIIKNYNDNIYLFHRYPGSPSNWRFRAGTLLYGETGIAKQSGTEKQKIKVITMREV